METMIATIVLFTCIIIGVPIAYSLAGASLVYAQLIPEIANQVIVQRFVRGPDSYEMIAIPMFILAAAVMSMTGSTEGLQKFANAAVGHVRGGLAHANVLGSMIFAGMSGSANADVAGLGRLEINMMVNEGYDPAFAAATTGSSSCIGPIIPPSTTLIIYGAIAGAPIAQLLIAGTFPGILMGILMMGYIAVIGKKRNFPKHYDSFSAGRVTTSIKESWPVLLTPLIIIVGILTGIFTATEAGVVATVYAILISLIFYKSFKVRDFKKVLEDCACDISMVMFLMSTGLAFSWVLSSERIPILLIEVITSMNLSKNAMILMIGTLYIILGMFFSVTTNLIMTVPVLVPLVLSYDISLVQFGVITVLALTIGCVTPPVGAPMYLACQFAGCTIGEFTKANLGYYAALILALLASMYIPQLTLFLPGLM